MSKIPDFTHSQIWSVESTFKESNPDSPVELQQLDHALREQEEANREAGQ